MTRAGQMPFNVVKADFDKPRHRDGFLEILDSYAADPIGDGEPLSAEVCERLIPALRAHPTVLVLLAIAEGRPVGTAVCFFGLSTFRALPLLNIHDLAVLPEWRGRGVGRHLLKAVEEEARARACCKLTLEVRGDNQRARQLYESLGFAEGESGQSGGVRFLTKPLEASSSEE